MINEEADRQKVQKGCRHDAGKGKPDEKDEALFVSSNSARGSGNRAVLYTPPPIPPGMIGIQVEW